MRPKGRKQLKKVDNIQRRWAWRTSLVSLAPGAFASAFVWSASARLDIVRHKELGDLSPLVSRQHPKSSHQQPGRGSLLHVHERNQKHMKGAPSELSTMPQRTSQQQACLKTPYREGSLRWASTLVPSSNNKEVNDTGGTGAPSRHVSVHITPRRLAAPGTVIRVSGDYCQLLPGKEYKTFPASFSPPSEEAAVEAEDHPLRLNHPSP